MTSTFYKLFEFLVIFIIIPISFSISFSIWIKLIIGVIGFLYIIYVLLKIEKTKFKMNSNLNWSLFCKETAIKLTIIALLTTIFVWYTDKEALFSVPLHKSLLWLIILFVYSFFSVYPQELIYRTFFFQRYQGIFKNESLLIFVNAIVFCLGHIFFRNTLVLILTFLGGLLFAFSFYKTKSTILVTVEHAIYGCWLFTVGMGDMLGFPS